MMRILLAALPIALTACTEPSALPPKIGMPNPASVYCQQQGGTLEIRKSAEGETGYCHLLDGRIVEEWAFFRANQRENTIPE